MTEEKMDEHGKVKGTGEESSYLMGKKSNSPDGLVIKVKTEGEEK